MKTNLVRNREAGFSLFELMAVVAIIVALTGLVIGTMGPVKGIVNRQRCDALMKKLESGLGNYQTEYGGYPICDDYNQGGATLFATMTGDLNRDGKPDVNEDDAIKIFIPDLIPPMRTDGTPVLNEDGEPKGRPDAQLIQGEWMVVDPWGTRMYYVNHKKGHPDAKNGGGKHNPTYDLWSTADSPENEANYRTNWN